VNLLKGLTNMFTPEPSKPHNVSQLNRYAIWWTTSEESRTISRHFECLPTWCPDYLQDEWRSRVGRNGRGRVWVPAVLGGRVPRVEFNNENPSALEEYVSEQCAGIVICAEHVDRLAHLPGIVTTFTLERWR
jgi:hypothetical protein